VHNHRCVDWERERRQTSAQEIRQELCAVYNALVGEPSDWAELPLVSLEAGGSQVAMARRGLPRLPLQSFSTVHYADLPPDSPSIQWGSFELVPE
jgi:hypothetical protein